MLPDFLIYRNGFCDSFVRPEGCMRLQSFLRDSFSGLPDPELCQRDWRGLFLFGLPLAVFLFLISLNQIDQGKWMWDFHVYQAAASAYILQLDAYDHAVIVRLAQVDLNFVYPPHAWWAMGHLPWLLTTQAGLLAYLAVYTFSIAAIIVLQAERMLPTHWARLPAAALIFFFLYIAGGISYQTGNIAIPAYALCFAALSYSLRRGQWLWFCFSVALFAQMKPHILVMLLIPLYYDWRQLKYAVPAGLLAVLPYLYDRYALPVQFQHFIDATHAQVMNHGDWGISGFGLLPQLAKTYGVFALVLHRTGLPPETVMAICGLFFIAMLAGMGCVMRHYRLTGRITMPAAVQLAWCILATVAANPRLKEYDICMATIPLAVVAGYVALHSKHGLLVLGIGYLLTTCIPVELGAFTMFLTTCIAGLMAATEPTVTLLRKADYAR